MNVQLNKQFHTLHEKSLSECVVLCAPLLFFLEGVPDLNQFYCYRKASMFWFAYIIEICKWVWNESIEKIVSNSGAVTSHHVFRKLNVLLGMDNRATQRLWDALPNVWMVGVFGHVTRHWKNYPLSPNLRPGTQVWIRATCCRLPQKEGMAFPMVITMGCPPCHPVHLSWVPHVLRGQGGQTPILQ